MYSGHGGQTELSETIRAEVEAAAQLSVDDPVKPSADRRKAIEFFIPYDMLVYASEADAALPILDVEFHRLLSRLEGRETHVWLDCCFSEGASRELLRRILEQPPVKWSKPDLAQVQHWQPAYRLFAAARYFQRALDLGDHGAFTASALNVFRKQPGSVMTNKELLTQARRYLHQDLAIPATSQEPVFFGPDAR